MTGTHYIRLYGKKISFDIKLERKITIIRGNSGTGKSTLANAVFRRINDKSGLTYQDKSTATLDILLGGTIRKNVNEIKSIDTDTIVVIDEDTVGIESNELASAINKSESYFVIITREILAGIPYSINSVMKMVTDKNNLHTLEPIYKPNRNAICKPQYIICEDSKSGYILFKMIDTNNNKVMTAYNKDKILDKAEQLFNETHQKILIVADGAAFGQYVRRLAGLIKTNKLEAYLPDSFEFVLLHSAIFKNDKELQDIINNPLDHIDSQYKSAEEFFEQLLNKKLLETGIGYNKSGLNSCFIDACCGKGKICGLIVKDRSVDKLQDLLSQMPIDFSDIFIAGETNKHIVKHGTYYIEE